MAKGWRNTSKGKTKDKKQAAAAEANEAARRLAELAKEREKRQREQDRDSGGSPPETHEPEHNGRGGKRQKLDVNKLSPNSRRTIEQARQRGATHRLKRHGKLAQAPVRPRRLQQI